MVNCQVKLSAAGVFHPNHRKFCFWVAACRLARAVFRLGCSHLRTGALPGLQPALRLVLKMNKAVIHID
jgi:hypothetical protein